VSFGFVDSCLATMGLVEDRQGFNLTLVARRYRYIRIGEAVWIAHNFFVATVCADATGSRSLVDLGSTGFLAKPGDVEAFAGHVRMMVEDAELRRRMGSAARERSLSLSWDDAMSPILGYYKKLVPVLG
jgi:glycosyltransferase involved in cell wall biosynthesis